MVAWGALLRCTCWGWLASRLEALRLQQRSPDFGLHCWMRMLNSKALCFRQSLKFNLASFDKIQIKTVYKFWRERLRGDRRIHVRRRGVAWILEAFLENCGRLESKLRMLRYRLLHVRRVGGTDRSGGGIAPRPKRTALAMFLPKAVAEIGF